MSLYPSNLKRKESGAPFPLRRTFIHGLTKQHTRAYVAALSPPAREQPTRAPQHLMAPSCATQGQEMTLTLNLKSTNLDTYQGCLRRRATTKGSKRSYPFSGPPTWRYALYQKRYTPTQLHTKNAPHVIDWATTPSPPCTHKNTTVHTQQHQIHPGLTFPAEGLVKQSHAGLGYLSSAYVSRNRHSPSTHGPSSRFKSCKCR